MNRITLHLTRPVYGNLLKHLLRPPSTLEEAAFLYVEARTSSDGGTDFHLVDSLLLDPSAFTYRTPQYLELKDETRAKVIKRAHDLQTSLVEVHSHPTFAPQFSASDESGLRQFVPHVWWRLKGKPYGAIVIAPTGYDALFWMTDPKKAATLSAIHVEGSSLVPSGRSLKSWEAGND